MALKYVVKSENNDAFAKSRKSVKKGKLKKEHKAKKIQNIEQIVILRQTPDIKHRFINFEPTFLTDPSTIESLKEMISKRRTTLTPIHDKFNFKSDVAKEQLLRSIIINDKRYVMTYVKNGGSVNFEVLNFVLEDPQLLGGFPKMSYFGVKTVIMLRSCFSQKNMILSRFMVKTSNFRPFLV